MILGRNLNNYPLLANNPVKLFEPFMPKAGESHSKHNNLLLNYYSVFVHIRKIEHSDLIKVVNSEKQLNHFNKTFIGFICMHVANTKMSVIVSSRSLLSNIAFLHALKLEEVKAGESKKGNILQSEKINCCINLFKDCYVDQARLKYWRGWPVKSKDGITSHLHLAIIYNTYGEKFTTNLHERMSAMVALTRDTTASSFRLLQTNLFNAFTKLFPTLPELFDAMSYGKQAKSMSHVMNYMILECKAKSNCMKTFIREKWPETVKYFNGWFVDTPGWFDESLIPILKPTYQAPKNLESVGESFNKSAKERLLTDIPLSYSDSKAMDVIFHRIRNDVEHLKFVCDLQIAKTMQRHDRNMKLLETGVIRTLNQRTPMGIGNLENVIATFSHVQYKMQGKHRSTTGSFFGFRKKTTKLKDELNIPTDRRLYPFLLRLVLEHPVLTPASLIQWKLYDKNGKVVGFRPSGDSYIIEVFKNRKGSSNAQQLIILNETSKKLCENIIKVTEHARGSLRANNSEDWQFMLLKCRSLTVLPTKYLRLIELSGKGGVDWREDYMVPSPYCSDPESINKLIENTSLRNARTSAGVLVYLETKSTTAMSEALGHIKNRPVLIHRYLPKALYEYFIDRWVRIFQNAIIFEAMKDSDYLLDAIDISEDLLHEFIDTHALGKLPEQLKRLGMITSYIEQDKAKNIEIDKKSQDIESIVLTLSVAQFQFYIAVIKSVESLANSSVITNKASSIYETGKLVVNMLDNHLIDNEQRLFRVSDEMVELYEIAKRKPLDQNMIMDLIICH